MHSLIYLYEILREEIQTDQKEIQIVIAIIAVTNYRCS